MYRDSSTYFRGYFPKVTKLLGSLTISLLMLLFIPLFFISLKESLPFKKNSIVLYNDIIYLTYKDLLHTPLKNL